MQNGPGTTHFVRLLDRIRSGDPTAKDELIRDAYERVHRRTHYILRGSFPNAGDLETGEIVGLTLEKFARSLAGQVEQRFANPAALFAYVNAVIRSATIDEIRRRSGRQFQTQFPGAPIPADLADSEAGAWSDGVKGRLSFEELIETLPEDEQRLLNYRFIGGMTDAEIADLLGLTRGAVSRQIRQVLVRLRGELDDDRGEPR